LWDVGNSAPYGHRGDLPTITEAIWAHGGEGRPSQDAFNALSADQQSAVIKFLKTLQVLPPGSPRVVYEDGSLPQAAESGTGGFLADSPLGQIGSSGSGLVLIVLLAAVLALVGLGAFLLYQRSKAK
jgi:hypothetical protein